MKKKILIVFLLSITVASAGLFDFFKKEKEKVTLNTSWEEIVKEAKGSEVNFYMWSGDEKINSLIDNDLALILKEEYKIKLNRIPVTDTKDIVNKLAVEKKANKNDGAVDILWINGENFRVAKEGGLLYGAIADKLPNTERYLNEKALLYDFGEEIDALEVPYGESQFVFVNDSAKLMNPPLNAKELKAFLMDNPGKFTYPSPPDFTGSAFIRHIVYELGGGYENFLGEFDEVEVREKLKPVWDYLNEIEPYLWRSGETYPESISKLNQLYSNGEVYITMGYHPLTAQSKIDEGLFPETSRTFLLENGTLFNNHYLTIPFNSENLAAALVTINTIITPEFQSLKAKPEKWGDGSVLDPKKLTEEELKLFEQGPISEASLPKEVLVEYRVPEISGVYVEFIEAEWTKNVAQN